MDARSSEIPTAFIAFSCTFLDRLSRGSNDEIRPLDLGDSAQLIVSSEEKCRGSSIHPRLHCPFHEILDWPPRQPDEDFSEDRRFYRQGIYML